MDYKEARKWMHEHFDEIYDAIYEEAKALVEDYWCHKFDNFVAVKDVSLGDKNVFIIPTTENKPIKIVFENIEEDYLK